MTNRIQESKIIAMQAIIFLSLLVMLSFILDGCAVREEKFDQIEVENQPLGYGDIGTELVTVIS